MKKIYFICLLGIFLLSNFFLTAEKYALVIGIRYDKFPGQEIPECTNDAKTVSALLQKEYDFCSSNIKIILAEEATKKNILDSLKDLYNKAQEKDQIVLYYSGHGAQIDDDNGDEDDDLDEAIVSYDKEYIRDEEIGYYIDKMSKKEAKVVVIFDSCYSGTGMKSFKINANPAKAYFSPKYYYNYKWQKNYKQKQRNLSPKQKLLRSAGIIREIKENNQSDRPETGNDNVCEVSSNTKGKVVFFSACSESEVSWTMKKKGHSAFTYHWLEAYKNNLQGDKNRDGVMTFEEAFEFIRFHVGKESFPTKQNPTIEAKLEKGEDHFYPGLFYGRAIPNIPAPAPRKLDIKEFLSKLVLKQNFTPSYSGWNVTLRLESNKKYFYLGERIKIYATANCDGYLILLNLTEKGAITLLYPNAESQNNKIEKHQTVSIPPKNARWYIQAQPPKGREWIIGYVFEKNPFEGCSIPDTFVKDFMVNCNVQDLHSSILEEENLKYIIQSFSNSKNSVIVREEVIEKWTKNSIEYNIR